MPTPWKNGGGTTRELLVIPAIGEWTLRVSVAQIQSDGPFSRFDNVTRWFGVLSKGSVLLECETQENLLNQQSPMFQFSGASATKCSLINGPTEDFNVMLRHNDASQQMTPITAQRVERIRCKQWLEPVSFLPSDARSQTAAGCRVIAFYANAPATITVQHSAASTQLLQLKAGDFCWADVSGTDSAAEPSAELSTNAALKIQLDSTDTIYLEMSL